MIDLRSDTVTKPTEAMRRAMAEAEVGDDVYGEDPTVNRLEELAAEMLGKEAGLLVTSGTQGNQVALLTHCRPGTEVILERESHIFCYEAGAAAALAGVQLCALPGRRGTLSGDQVAAAVREDDIHAPPTALVCLENTHNRAGGAVIPLAAMEEVYQVAAGRGIPVHLDGARLFNAAVASKIPAREYAARADTVQICLSKGLGAPVGSVLVGPAPWIAEARRWRKRLGGGMRQAGVIAAPGIIALQEMVDRLAEDHQNARYLAERLAELPGFLLDPAEVETNIVVAEFTLFPVEELVASLEARGVRIIAFGQGKVRLTTHKDVSRQDIEKALQIIKSVATS
ncbi:MAG TPA: low-specificity L-threonine aldolase [Bacillota bacterium]|jgi:threonine aldolase|nr:low-specificity L-threonine aldolase [Bacillota bacterium]HOB86480.1 low-specificity L-threonine aldolase [Bacillota bacterium]HOP68781.1 low-specificity L-threonine aldolase [Bacillota bacterium]HPT33852.1 low-specificity L-threonine aldolase [Bacillota bacterium]HQD06448.1 low-specificity L-threonine aldolase [Bacillota bacterium]